MNINEDEPVNPASASSVMKARKVFVKSLTKDPDAYIAVTLDGKPSDKQLETIRTYIRANTPQRLDTLVKWLYNRAVNRWELGVISATPSII